MFLQDLDLDWFFDTLENTKISNTDTKVKPKSKKDDNYPLTDVGYAENNELFINVACPGFTKDNIEIEIINFLLEVQ